jgi:hypothetical protein
VKTKIYTHLPPTENNTAASVRPHSVIVIIYDEHMNVYNKTFRKYLLWLCGIENFVLPLFPHEKPANFS